MTPTPKTINDVQSQQKVTTAATNFGVSRPAERVIIVSSLCKSRLLRVCIVKEKKIDTQITLRKKKPQILHMAQKTKSARNVMKYVSACAHYFYFRSTELQQQ